MPKDVADRFLLAKEKSFSILIEALETDENENNVPDSCENNKTK